VSLLGPEAVRALLETLNIAYSVYSIGLDEDQAYCLVASGGEWVVYYSERGHRNSAQSFSNESDACEELLRRVLGDGVVRRLANADALRALDARMTKADHL
jgi:hypothetical protein